MNDYYDVTIKEWRLIEIEKKLANYTDISWIFMKGSIADKVLIYQIFDRYCS